MFIILTDYEEIKLVFFFYRNKWKLDFDTLSISRHRLIKPYLLKICRNFLFFLDYLNFNYLKNEKNKKRLISLFNFFKNLPFLVKFPDKAGVIFEILAKYAAIIYNF